MQLRWLDPDNPHPRDLAGAAAVLEAARVTDCPHEPAVTLAFLTAYLRHGWDGHPGASAVATDDSGRIAAVLEVDLPRWDNAHLGRVNVTVDPYARRRGLGRRLFDIGVAKVREHGRRMVLAYGFDLPATVAFAKAVGLERAGVEAKRRLDLLELDQARIDQMYESTRAHAAGYDLVRIDGLTPEHMLAGMVAMTGSINDAPTDDLDIEDEVYSPERIHAFERTQLAYGRRLYRVVARHRGTGELAGHTMVAVESQLPGYGHQHDTTVVGSHRGHRLGLHLKIAMLSWLAEAEPQLRVLDAWNATSNTRMVAVNEELGYRFVAHGFGWQRPV